MKDMSLALLLALATQAAPGGPRLAETATTASSTVAPPKAPLGVPPPPASPCDPACKSDSQCLETSRGFVCVAKKAKFRKTRRRRGAKARSSKPTAEKARFGDAGTFTVDGSAGGGFLTGGGSVDVRLGGGLRYFVSKDIAGRLLTGLQYQGADGGVSQLVGSIGAGLGGNIRINESASFLAEAAVVYSAVDFGESDVADLKLVLLRIDLSLILAVTDHVFFGMGPQVQVPISASIGGRDADASTTFGLNLSFGLNF